MQQIKEGKTMEEIKASWAPGLENFKKIPLPVKDRLLILGKVYSNLQFQFGKQIIYFFKHAYELYNTDGDPEILFSYIDALTKVGNFNEAYKILRQATTKDYRYHLHKGLIYIQDENTELATKQLEKALQKGGDHLRVRYLIPLVAFSENHANTIIPENLFPVLGYLPEGVLAKIENESWFGRFKELFVHNGWLTRSNNCILSAIKEIITQDGQDFLTYRLYTWER